MKLAKMSNKQLYEEWKDALDLSMRYPSDRKAIKREEECLDEIVKRMQGEKPLVMEEA